MVWGDHITRAGGVLHARVIGCAWKRYIGTCMLSCEGKKQNQ